MFKIDPDYLANMSLFDPKKYALYEHMQEEICNVIEFSGDSPTLEKSHQLYDSLFKLAQGSPKTIVQEFQSTPRLDPVLVWNEQRCVELIQNFRLDPLKDWVTMFRISRFTQFNDNSVDAYASYVRSENTPFTFESSQNVKLIYQDKIGSWFSAFSSVGNEIQITNLTIDSNEIGLIRYSDFQEYAKFYLNISPSGYISVISPQFAYLRPSRLIFSEFRSIRRPT